MTLKLERVKRNLTQKELRKISGVSVLTIGKIEKGEKDTVKLGIYKKLAKALDITIEELIKEQEV
ncbi:helix-turn-helix domain-containing protein [Peptacetobacter hiranonis]|uniref:helix-turn-helix domain-containing protein n=1 Tax=Peptacetobacter hiranonis TaxID=89152 RepID=UPI0022E0B63A|nr:helix-turn-helix transcriptional regulator [Peptacetobacter hiranonis]